MSKYVKDNRVGTVLKVSDAVAEMVLKDPDIVEVGVEAEKPAKRSPKSE